MRNDSWSFSLITIILLIVLFLAPLAANVPLAALAVAASFVVACRTPSIVPVHPAGPTTCNVVTS